MNKKHFEDYFADLLKWLKNNVSTGALTDPEEYNSWFQGQMKPSISKGRTINVTMKSVLHTEQQNILDFFTEDYIESEAIPSYVNETEEELKTIFTEIENATDDAVEQLIKEKVVAKKPAGCPSSIFEYPMVKRRITQARVNIRKKVESVKREAVQNLESSKEDFYKDITWVPDRVFKRKFRGLTKPEIAERLVKNEPADFRNLDIVQQNADKTAASIVRKIKSRSKMDRDDYLTAKSKAKLYQRKEYLANVLSPSEYRSKLRGKSAEDIVRIAGAIKGTRKRYGGTKAERGAREIHMQRMF